MKLNKLIMGCALATGLMTFATVQSQAGIVIGNSVYAPLSLKMTYNYIDSNGKTKKMSGTNKDILNYWEYTKANGFPKAQLAINTDTGDVWVIYKDGDSYVTWYNETEGEYLWANTTTYDSYWSGYTGDNIESKGNETGLVNVQYYSDGWWTDSYYTFDADGTYTSKWSQSDYNSDYIYKYKTSFKTSNLSGSGYNWDIDQTCDVTGKASASGNGKVEAL
jgi:hypothetical protein